MGTGLGGLGGDQNGNDTGAVAREVEVLEIKSIIPRLLQVSLEKAGLSYLEFEDKDHIRQDDDSVNATPDSGTTNSR